MEILFIILIILIILISISNNNKQNNSSKPITANNLLNENTQISPMSYKNYYKPKIYITTLNEMKFYNVLLEIAKELDYILFSQVSLYNIVTMQDNLDYGTHMKYFNKIASKSTDFVLVDKNCRIKLCIELDDSSHKAKKRIERDKFIDELFKELEIDLLRYPTYNVYYKDTLKRKIQENINEHIY